MFLLKLVQSSKVSASDIIYRCRESQRVAAPASTIDSVLRTALRSSGLGKDSEGKEQTLELEPCPSEVSFLKLVNVEWRLFSFVPPTLGGSCSKKEQE